MSDRKKILFIARWYPDRHDIMLGLFVQKHAQAVQALHDVSVLYVTADSSLEPGLIITNEVEFEGIREYRIYFGKHKSELYNAVAYAKWYLKGLSLVRKNSGLPDLVHVHILSRTAFPAIWLKITKGIPYIITEHWSRYLPANVAKGAYSGWLRRFFTKRAVAMAEGVTTVTQNLASAMQNLGLRNTYHITPNVADVHDFKPLENYGTEPMKKLVHVSCFDEPAKNIKGIINAVQKIAPLRDDFYLEIIGDGKDFESIREYAKKTGLVNSRIRFTGLLTGEILSKKMREANAFVMFSNYENLPCTIVESLCSGVPVISTDVGGIREHVKSEFGMLMNPGDENALISAINNVLDHPEKFDKVRMRTYAVQQFSMESIGKLFNEIYLKYGIKKKF